MLPESPSQEMQPQTDSDFASIAIETLEYVVE